MIGPERTRPRGHRWRPTIHVRSRQRCRTEKTRRVRSRRRSRAAPRRSAGTCTPARPGLGPVHEHRRFHGRDAAGSATQTHARASTPSQFGLIVASYTLSAGLAGLLASSVLDRFGRQAGVPLALLGLPGRDARSAASRSTTRPCSRPGSSPGRSAAFWAGMALAIIGDVFPEERRGRATGVLMSAFALASVARRPVLPGPGNAVRLARSLPDPGGLRAAGPAVWPAVHAAAPRSSRRPGPCAPLGPGSARPSATPTTCGPSPHLRDHVRRLLGDPVHQPLPRVQRRSDRGEPDLGVRDRGTVSPWWGRP